MGLAKAGVKALALKIFALLAAKNHFVFYFLIILKKRKWFLLSSGLVEKFVLLISAFAKPFSVVGKANRRHRKRKI
ncbi:Uncharacterised protein [Chryseobacterium taklimakanense]|uniref:Uncharacterized protein n=1 Tax=Chryseobacterium taklimakanense TaxID=536441 RepID=A0A239WQQ6_9FLAO|nr:Uncharacterised protein [Chryseobacterium taklimakanense]